MGWLGFSSLEWWYLSQDLKEIKKKSSACPGRVFQTKDKQKDLKLGLCFKCLRDSKEASVGGKEWATAKVGPKSNVEQGGNILCGTSGWFARILVFSLTIQEAIIGFYWNDLKWYNLTYSNNITLVALLKIDQRETKEKATKIVGGYCNKIDKR